MPPNGSNGHRPQALELDDLRLGLRDHLQNMASLINLQIRHAQHPETVRALEDLRARFSSIVGVYIDLDEAGVPIATEALLARFVHDIAALYDPAGNYRLDVDIAPVRLSGKQAVILGQIVVELLINAYRHGLAGRSHGVVRVAFAGNGSHALLTVEDDGPGLRDADPGRAHLGFTLVASLARSLGGAFEHENRDGFVARVHVLLDTTADTN